ncbi:hypothetical protein N9891_01625, partial [bacterium]|nr:hypothetical protein [bacterium]
LANVKCSPKNELPGQETTLSRTNVNVTRLRAGIGVAALSKRPAFKDSADEIRRYDSLTECRSR